MPRDIGLLVTELEEALREATARNEHLQREIAAAERRVRAGQNEAESAAAEAQELSTKLARLRDLTNTEYQHLITELFEAPSRRAARLTVLVAIISIVFAVLITIVSSFLASRDSAAIREQALKATERLERETAARLDEVRRNLSATLEETKRNLSATLEETKRNLSAVVLQSERRIATRLDPLSVSYPSVRQIVGLLNANREGFNNYQTPNDIALFYKLRLVDNLPPTDYSLYSAAFREALPPTVVLPRQNDFSTWDADMIALYSNWFTRLIKVADPPPPESLFFRAYKRDADRTDYGAWSQKSFTSTRELQRWVSSTREKFREQQNHNQGR